MGKQRLKTPSGTHRQLRVSPEKDMMADNKPNRKNSSDDGVNKNISGSFEHSCIPQSRCSPCTGGGDGTAVKRTSHHLTPEDEDQFSADQPAPCKTPKIGFSMGSKMAKKSNPISIKLGATKPKETAPSLPPKKLVSVFNEDDDSEPEEMPPEAKMRMKNIGRETPTSAGPNSFNKG
ncbi:hypothetical protein AMECASPLE_018376 [Ameca splendens]|uniref:PEST proteolytic signal-containing nuclear protein n=1 Tax=Ameca splendens TaxID=208324 RepID=A0ABV0ZND7_9TELE